MFDLHNVYATSVPLNPVAESSVASAESALNAHFPEGYREYVTTLGLGVLSNYIRVYSPEDVVNDLPEFRNRVNEYFFWDQGAQLLPKDRVLECIWIADTLNGDEVVFHPSDSRKLYLLPRDSEKIFELGPTLNDALDWLLDQAGLNVDGAVTTFDRACQTYSFSLIPVDKMPRWADLKKRILKLNLHDRVEESNQHPPTLTFYIQNIGGGITVAGRGMNYTLQFSHSVSRDDQFLKTVLDQLEELGFIPPLNEAGEMHPAVANLLERTFSLKKHFPCKIPPEQRTPRDVVVSFINVMYAFEKGLRKWNEAGYPHPLAMQLCATITQDLCIPGSTVNSFGNPPQYDPKKEDPQQTDSFSDETEVSFSTEVKDHFKTKHKFVVRKLDGVWKLAEVWSVLGGGFSDDPDRIL